MTEFSAGLLRASPGVLIVDDCSESRLLLGDLLGRDYRVQLATSGAGALQLAGQDPLPDLILLDMVMPDISGHEVLRHLRAGAATREIPVIITTGMTATEDELEGLELGAVDYLVKPLRPAVVLARVRRHLELKLAIDRLRGEKRDLEGAVARSSRASRNAQDLTLCALARLAETRDNETGNHILRTQRYVSLLAQRLADHPRFAAALDERSIALIAKSAPLHDIGKVGIPDQVLLKPGRLDAVEWEVMKSHARLGADVLARAEADIDGQAEFLDFAKQIALHHHERWDGSGYPDGLAGEAIPMAARLMAIADVFDALTSPRVYKAAMPFERALEVMVGERGRHFDPDMIDAFAAGYAAFSAAAREHADPGAIPAPGG